MQHVVHLDLHVEDELSREEVLAKGRLGVKLLRDVDPNLLGYLGDLLDLGFIYKSVAATEGTLAHGGGQGHGVLAILEDQTDDVVDSVHSLVHFVVLVSELVYEVDVGLLLRILGRLCIFAFVALLFLPV